VLNMGTTIGAYIWSSSEESATIATDYIGGKWLLILLEAVAQVSNVPRAQKMSTTIEDPPMTMVMT
jgi:hypothetical protein